jgi:hypothetical protein
VTAEVMMVLQNYTTSENILVVPYGETYPANHDAKQATIIKDLKVSDTEDIHHMIITHGRKSTTTKEENLILCNYTNNTSTGGNIRTNISNRPVLSSERAPSQG